MGAIRAVVPDVRGASARRLEISGRCCPLHLKIALKGAPLARGQPSQNATMPPPAEPGEEAKAEEPARTHEWIDFAGEEVAVETLDAAVDG